MPDFLTRKVAGKVPVWVLLVAAVALGLYLRWRASRGSNPQTTAEDLSMPDFTDTTGQAWNASTPPNMVPTVVVVDASSTAPAPPVDQPSPGQPAPGENPAAPPPADAPPAVGGGMPNIPQAAHDAPPPPPVYHPPSQPNGFVNPDPATFGYAAPAYWEPVPTPVDPNSGAIARDRDVEGL